LVTLAVFAFGVIWMIRGCQEDDARNAEDAKKHQQVAMAGAAAVAAVKEYYRSGYAEAGDWGRWRVVTIKRKDTIWDSTVVDVVLDLPDRDAQEIMSRNSGAQAVAVKNACPHRLAKSGLSMPNRFSVELQPEYGGTIFDDVQCPS